MPFLSPDDFIVLMLLASTSDFIHVFSYRSPSRLLVNLPKDTITA